MRVESRARFNKLSSRAGRGVTSAITEASEIAGVNADHMLAIAKVESAFRPGAKASTSSASGLFQFIRGTWVQMVKRYGAQHGIGVGDVMDPRANAIMGAYFMKENSNALKRTLGREPNLREVYLAHFAGVGTATKAMKALKANPHAPASAAFSPSAIRANRGIFYSRGKQLSLAAAIEKLTNKVAKA